MYQPWPTWGGTSAASASTTAAGFVQPAAAGTVAATQWPANYNQYASVTPELQQQWAAAWASQAQFAYSGAVPVAGQVPTTTATPYSGYPDSQTQTTDNNVQTPSEKPKISSEELAPKDSSESDKLKQLKEQAEQWKSLQQPAAAAATSWPYATGVSATATSVTTSGKPLKSNENTNTTQSNIEQQAQLDQEEEEFDRQFKEWEKQFEAWKEQNINHPDKEAFAQYEKQWQEWRAQLLQKKEQIQKDKAARLAQQSGSTTATTAGLTLNTSTMPATTSSGGVQDSSAVANSNLYYQQAQYMYMQPYVYPGTVPVAPPAVPPQFPFTGQPGPAPAGNFAGPPPIVNNGGPPMNVPNSNMNSREMKAYDQESEQYKYGQGGENTPHPDDSYGHYDDYGNSVFPPPNMEDPYQREMNFGRGRARGRGHGRGRGRGRWSEPNQVDGPPPPNARSQGPALLDNPPDFPEGPGKFRDGPGDFREGPGGQGGFPPGRFPRGPRDFPPGPPRDFPPGPPRDFPPGPPRDFPPGPRDFRGPPRDFPPVNEFGDKPRKFNDGKFPEGLEEFPPGPNNRPPYEYPPDDYLEDYSEGQDFPEGHARQGQNFPDEHFHDGQPPHREGKPPLLPRDGQKPLLPQEERPPLLRDGEPRLRDEIPPPYEDQQPPLLRNRPPGGFPPSEFDEPYHPEPYEDRFPPDSDRFPPGPKNDRFMMDRQFDGYPPMDDRGFGPPPPFEEDFPPFDDRFPPGRGRFPPRGRRFPPGHRNFERFGPPGMRDEGPPFGPDDRYPPFSGDGPPRMGPPGRGSHRPPFGPGNHSRFPPDEPYFREGGPPMRFKSVDYTHRSSADFDPHYEFESEFQDDVGQFRDNFCKDKNLIPHDPIIFSQVPVESFDYGHGMKPMSSTMIPAKKEIDSKAPVKVFDYSHRLDRGSPHRDRGYFSDRNEERSLRERGPPLRDRNRDKEKDRDHRDSERERDRDRSRKDTRDLRERDYDNRERDRDRGDRENKRGRDWERDRHREDSDNRDRDRFRDDSDRDRDRYREDADRDSKRFKWDAKADSEKNSSKDRSSHSSSQKKESTEGKKTQEVPSQFKTPPPVFKSDSSVDSYLIEDLLNAPKRLTRPKQLVIILRGLPGSGKTYVAKLIKDKEIENGGSAPRILSLDDYFMVEKEVTDVDPDTGKKVKRKEFKFEYEIEMEEAYRSSLFKSFKKTIDDRFFPFIIVDAVHEKSKQYEQYWSYAKQRGFQVYIAEMDCKDPVICHKRNIHDRSLEDINKILESWEPKPRHFMIIDVRSLLQDVAIQEVEMEVESDNKKGENDKEEEESSNNVDSFHVPSRWEKLEATEEKLDQLDGLRVSKKKHSSMEDYLQLPDDYDDRKCEPGKKRVRWADLEERKEQDRLRAIGFVVGQTDWTKMTDPTHADRALTKTKYF